MRAAEDVVRAVGARQATLDVRPGVVVDDPTGGVRVNVDGAYPQVMWPSGAAFTVGDPVRVLIGPGGAQVLAPVTTTPRPVTGTVAGSAAGGLVPVTTTSGEVQARYTGTAPSLGTPVRLDWAGSQPWVWPGAVAATSTSQPVAPAEPPASQPRPESGTLRLPAVDSASWAVHRGAWSSTTGTDVLQGMWGSLVYRGYWWLGAAPTALRGRTLTGFRLWVPARRAGMGQWSIAAQLRLTTHPSMARGRQEPARDAGPWAFTVAPDHKGAWVSPPLALAQQLVNNGGGLALAGDPYAGVVGVGADARSGRVEIDWRR